MKKALFATSKTTKNVQNQVFFTFFLHFVAEKCFSFRGFLKVRRYPKFAASL